MAAKRKSKKSKKRSSKRTTTVRPQKRGKQRDGHRTKAKKRFADVKGTRVRGTGTSGPNQIPLGLLKKRHAQLGALILRRESLVHAYNGIGGMRAR